MRSWLYILLGVLLYGCFTPDEVLPPTQSYITNIQLSMDSNQYAYVNLKAIEEEYLESEPWWHLRMQNSEDGWAIHLNTLRNVVVYNTSKTNYDEVSVQDYNPETDWQMDIPTAEGLQPAIGTWGDYSFPNPKSFKNVFLILWKSSEKTFLYKLQVLDARTDAYHLRYGPLNNDTTYSAWVPKDNRYAHSYFSFTEHKKMEEVEPPLDAWDICFTYIPDSIKSHQVVPEKLTLNPHFGIYQGLQINYRSNLLNIDTTLGFEQMDYFYASKLEYYTADQLFGTFASWDATNNSIVIDDKLTLLLKDGEEYFAIRAVNYTRLGDRDYTINLEIKQL